MIALSEQAGFGKSKDDGARVTVLKEKAAAALEDALTDDQRAESFETEVYGAARRSILKLIHVGGCDRNYDAPCPAGWDLQGGVCSPPESYTGVCAPRAHGSSSRELKEEFAWCVRHRPVCL